VRLGAEVGPRDGPEDLEVVERLAAAREAAGPGPEREGPPERTAEFGAARDLAVEEALEAAIDPPGPAGPRAGRAVGFGVPFIGVGLLTPGLEEDTLEAAFDAASRIRPMRWLFCLASAAATLAFPVPESLTSGSAIRCLNCAGVSKSLKSSRWTSVRRAMPP